MLLIGSDDGLYRVPATGESDADGATQVLASDSVMRVRGFEGVDGHFAATASGLYHSADGETWTDLGVPERRVYAVGTDPAGDRLYAGTRPAAVYVTDLDDDGIPEGASWRELSSFQELPSREEWRLPRHDDLAQVRDLAGDPDAPDRVVAGVEVGGVHVGAEGGESWTERNDGMDDDVHELRVAGPGVYLAATGFGLFRTTDAGRTWTRLDEGRKQRYFRSVLSVDGTVYAGAAVAHPATWDEDDADPALLVSRDGETLDRVDHPRPDEVVTGLTAAGGTVYAATHRGTLLAGDADGWAVRGTFPVPESASGLYTPLSWLGR